MFASFSTRCPVLMRIQKKRDHYCLTSECATDLRATVLKFNMYRSLIRILLSIDSDSLDLWWGKGWDFAFLLRSQETLCWSSVNTFLSAWFILFEFFLFYVVLSTSYLQVNFFLLFLYNKQKRAVFIVIGGGDIGHLPNALKAYYLRE
jgi:hypothetical protein